MAVTPVGNPYVESSDLVANYPGASEALAERIDIVGVNPFANAAARDAAIPSPVQGQMCSLNDDNKGYRYDGSAWVLFSGAGPANFTNTATGTFSSGGISYKYITFTGSGDLIVDQAGFADILVVAGGGGGGGGDSNRNGGGGGAGGFTPFNSLYLPAATHTIAVGGGGVGSATRASITRGNDSSLGLFVVVGGGEGASGTSVESVNQRANGGGSSGGTPNNTLAAKFAIVGQGNVGAFGSSSENAGGGGGGANAAGSLGVTTAGGAGGAGTASSITGSSIIRSGGGGGSGSSTSGTGGSGGGGAGSTAGVGISGAENTGGGGGATRASGQASGSGGSGLVIVRVVV